LPTKTMCDIISIIVQSSHLFLREDLILGRRTQQAVV